MKKKFLATLVAGAILSVGLTGLTACGGGSGSISKGVEVSEEEWKAAFSATTAAANFTVTEYDEIGETVDGTFEDISAEEIHMTYKQVTESTAQHVDGSMYSSFKVKETYTGVPKSLKDKYKNASYTRERYTDKYSAIATYEAYYNSKTEGAEWTVYASTGSAIKPTRELYNTYATEKGGAVRLLSNLYEAFTYSKGVYTATLYTQEVGHECKIEISIKDGYVIGYSSVYTAVDEDEEGVMTETTKHVYNFSNFGTTELKPSAAAKQAVEDFKNS